MNDRKPHDLPFVLLFHDLSDATSDELRTVVSHWDLMVARDGDGPLATWALTIRPDFESDEKQIIVPATRLDDHRRAYLEYEGTVSGNRGTVSRVTAGHAVWNRHDDVSDSRQFLLVLPNGEKWRADFSIDDGKGAITFQRSDDG